MADKVKKYGPTSKNKRDMEDMDKSARGGTCFDSWREANFIEWGYVGGGGGRALESFEKKIGLNNPLGEEKRFSKDLRSTILKT